MTGENITDNPLLGSVACLSLIDVLFLCAFLFISLRTAQVIAVSINGESDNYLRDASYKVHFCLVADAGQICVHRLTFRTSCSLVSLIRRNVEAVVVVEMPVSRTRWANDDKNKARYQYAILTSMAVQFYLGFCSKSSTLAEPLAGCQYFLLSSSAVG